MKVSSFKNYFTKLEICIWSCSVLMIISSFLIFDRQNYLNLVTSLIGVTALIFIAKGNPIGQMLCIIFGLIYGIISFKFKYYGEVITYVGMTMPMAVIALISWLKNPAKKGKMDVYIPFGPFIVISAGISIFVPFNILLICVCKSSIFKFDSLKLVFIVI